MAGNMSVKKLMKINDQESPKEFLSCLIDKKCQSCVFEKGDLLLLFGDIVQMKPLRTTWVLRICCKWRLRDHKGIVAAHGDFDEERARLALSKVEGATLNHVEHSAVSHDMKLSFHNGLSIETFSNSVMYEQWCLQSSDGLEYEIGPGLTPRVVRGPDSHEN